MLSGMFTGFVVAPFLVHHLGETTYGLWILVLAFASSLGLLDFGLRASIGRHLALFHARQDFKSLQEVQSTARVILLGAALVALVVTLALQLIFARAFSVPAEEAPHIRAAVMVIGSSVVWMLSMGLYDAKLWAYERFDVINAIECTASIAQAIGAVAAIKLGYSVLALATSVLGVALFREGAKCLACQRLPTVADAHARPSWRIAGILFRFAIWNSLWTTGARLTQQCVSFIVGARLSTASVTTFNISSSLTNYARSFVSTGAGVLIPVATAMHATERRNDQQRLFLESTMYCWFLSLLLTIGLILLGRTFITLWMGPAFAPAAGLLIILIIGEALPMSQFAATGFLMSMNRQRILAALSISEALVIFALGFVLARSYGLIGICGVIALSGFVLRGVVPMVYTCRALGVPLGRCVAGAIVPPLLILALPAAAASFFVHRFPPVGWVQLVLYSAVLGSGLLLLGWRVLPRGEIAAGERAESTWSPAAIAESV
jgi:O-antigen/teichoic acid export membrane protein